MGDKKIIVRADFYPGGEIIPLGITDAIGNSQYIDKIIRIEKENNQMRYICLSSKKKIILIYRNGVWKYE